MIDSFRNEHFFLSNFFPGDRTALEMKYQAAKFLDPALQKEILSLPTPGHAKRRARVLQQMGYLRFDWQQVKLGIMENLLREKFSDPVLKYGLLNTEDEELIEGNYFGDCFWGCIKENEKWAGENHLGKLLMKIRNEIKNDES